MGEERSIIKNPGMYMKSYVCVSLHALYYCLSFGTALHYYYPRFIALKKAKSSRFLHIQNWFFMLLKIEAVCTMVEKQHKSLIFVFKSKTIFCVGKSILGQNLDFRQKIELYFFNF